MNLRERAHLENLLPDLKRLIRTGRDKPDVISLIVTETTFRGRQQRAAEYLYWLALSILGSQKRFHITLGCCQASYKYWLTHGNLPNGLIRQVICFCDIRANYDVCEKILGELPHPYSSDELLEKYNGFPTAYYKKVFLIYNDYLRCLVSSVIC